MHQNPILSPHGLPAYASSEKYSKNGVVWIADAWCTKPPIWATRLLIGWGFPQASSPSTLTLTSLRANDTLSALTAKGRHSPGPSCSPPTPGLLAAHCCPQHTIAQATW